MMCPRRRCFSEEKRELMKGCGPRVKMGMGTVPQGGDGVGEMILLQGKGDSWEEGRKDLEQEKNCLWGNQVGFWWVN
jgi:hypothetical protein